MSFSLYGALPPSKSGKDSEKAENNTTTTTSNSISSLYSSLPAPESSSFQKDVLKDSSTPSIETPSPATTLPTPIATQPTG